MSDAVDFRKLLKPLAASNDVQSIMSHDALQDASARTGKDYKGEKSDADTVFLARMLLDENDQRLRRALIETNDTRRGPYNAFLKIAQELGFKQIIEDRLRDPEVKGDKLFILCREPGTMMIIVDTKSGNVENARLLCRSVNGPSLGNGGTSYEKPGAFWNDIDCLRGLRSFVSRLDAIELIEQWANRRLDGSELDSGYAYMVSQRELRGLEGDQRQARKQVLHAARLEGLRWHLTEHWIKRFDMDRATFGYR